MATFPDRLKEIRKQRGITQRSVAQFLDITDQSYQKYEYGMREPNHATTIKLANFFDIPMDYLMGRSDNLNAVILTERVKLLLSDKRLDLDAKGLYMQLYNNGVDGISVLPCEDIFLQENGISKVGFDDAVNRLVNHGYINIEDIASAENCGRAYRLI